MRVKILLILALVVAPAVGNTSETLMYEDFQDGESDGWQGFGDGTIRITEYQGNASLQISIGTAAVRRVDLMGVSRVRIGASFAATGLDDDGACVAEVTLDDGHNWSTVSRVVAGQDDGIALHHAALSHDVAAPTGSLWIRARVAGDSASARCWLDNVYAIGDVAKAATDKEDHQRQLSFAFMRGAANLVAPISMQEFSKPQTAMWPTHVFSGSLRLHNTASAGHMKIVADDWGRQADIGAPIGHLPEFDFEFAQEGHDLIPLQRGVQRREHPYWEIILQPGRAWNEVDDDGWTRAAVPFSLQERSANCTHNGVLSWLFNATEVSRVVYQISSETCGYLKLDMWGAVAATYAQKDLAEASRPHFDRLTSHRSSRLPVRDLSQLAVDYPGVEPLSFGIDDGIHPDDISVLGIVAEGIHYRSQCYTRQGPYPFCDSLPLPSYSTAKSIFAAVAMMRIEALFPGASKTPLASLVKQCESKKWREVSVENALDMATGNYRSTKPSDDEDSLPSRKFIFDNMHKTKIDFSCNQYKRKSKPGSQFVYHTSDTYLVGTALREMLRERTESNDVYRDLLVDPIWRRLQLSPLLDDTKRTYDKEKQPFVGYGLTYETDDIVRIADWLSRDNGVVGETHILDASMLNASLQKTASDRGLDTGYPDVKYNNGFWAFNAGPSLGCKNAAWVPFMSGVSGITISMFPNGVTYYYFSDGYVFRWQSAIQAAHTIKGLCK